MDSFPSLPRVSIRRRRPIALACPSARTRHLRLTHTHIHTSPHPLRPGNAVRERAAGSFPGASAGRPIPFFHHRIARRNQAGGEQFYATYPRAPHHYHAAAAATRRPQHPAATTARAVHTAAGGGGNGCHGGEGLHLPFACFAQRGCGCGRLVGRIEHRQCRASGAHGAVCEEAPAGTGLVRCSPLYVCVCAWIGEANGVVWGSRGCSSIYTHNRTKTCREEVLAESGGEKEEGIWPTGEFTRSI